MEIKISDTFLQLPGKKICQKLLSSFSISLTDEGMLLRDRAQDLVAMSDMIEQEFNSLDDITGGNIYFRLCCTV